MRKICLFLVFAFATTLAYAGVRVVENRMIFNIPFVASGSDYKDINYALDSLAFANSLHQLKCLNQDSTVVIKSVEFYGSVSPDGSYKTNKRICEERIVTAEKLVREHLYIADSVKVSHNVQLIPWEEYLSSAIDADKYLPYRKEFLDILSLPKNRRAKLLHTYEGRLWRIAKMRYFDYMRRGGAIITYEQKIYDKPEPEPIASPTPTEAVSEVAEELKAVSIKTNLLAYSALIANIGVEIKLAERWSLDIIGTLSPYDLFVRNRKVRLFGVRPEVRFWWGEAMKRGHFIGLHGFTSAFNIQINNSIRIQDPNYALWGAGLAYGYMLPLGKKEKWGLEFTLGVGYARIKYDLYEGKKNGQFIEQKTVNYFGPTRLGVNLSYRFDIENKNNKREKKRE